MKLITVLLIILLTSALAWAEPEKKTILYLNSYHDGYNWSDKQLEGIRSVLETNSFKIDLQIEYFDAKKYNYEFLKSRLFTLYTDKFRNDHFDIIIISDNDALNFIQEYRQQLFPGVPVVFCGINGIETIDPREKNITGIIENFDLAKTLNLARHLHPDKKHMIVLGDDSTAGQAIKNQIMQKMAAYDPSFHVEFWSHLTVEETITKVKTLPNDTFLFFIPWYQTLHGRFLTTEEVIRAIYSQSSVPLYTAWDFLLGHGVVGGYLLSGFQHGQTAATMALQVLNGQSVNSIPIENGMVGEYMFDYEVMKRLKINEDLLPEGAIIINSPKAFYELSKELFWTIMVSFLLLLAAMVSLLIALSERRKVEREVLEQLSFREALMDTIPQLVSWKDTNGKYLGANRSFSEFFGVTAAENIIAKTAQEIIPDQEYSRWSSTIDAIVVARGEAFRKMRQEIAYQGATTSWLEVNKVPLRDQTGKVVGVLTTAENITKEHNLEKQLIQSQKMEAIGTLAGGIAHDFNNILTSIINSTELALGDLDADSQTAADLQRVHKAARRGARLVKQILSFSRPSREGFQPTDIAQVVQEVHSLVEASLPAYIKIESDISPGNMMVDSDPTQIHQIILNLCTNSFHALRENGGSIRISLGECQVDPEMADTLSIPSGHYVKLTVADSGHGIPPEILDKIFDPFFSTKDITEGTGLGLAVVHGIIKVHKGAIQVSSAPGEGTLFTIYLPRSNSVGVLASQDRQYTRSRPLSILFVEDDEDQLNSIPRILRDMGHRVVALQDPLLAVYRARQKPVDIDIIISDYDMPALNGADLAETLSEFPFILVSGREEVIATANHANIIKVLVKPYDRHDLKEALDHTQNLCSDLHFGKGQGQQT